MDFNERQQKLKMITDLIIQAFSIILIIITFLFMYKIPQKYISKLRSKTTTAKIQARRHFIAGAQHLSKSTKNNLTSAQLALNEADKSISLDPNDAASHILKALALDLLGFKTSAIDAIDVALSPLAVKSLDDEERGDALYKRAELRIGVSGNERVEVVNDLTESVRLKGDNVKAFVLLGECYEKKDIKKKAIEAYQSAIRVDSNNKVAREALLRLGDL